MAASLGAEEAALVGGDQDLDPGDGTCVLCGGDHIGTVDGDLRTMLFAATKWNRTVARPVGLALLVEPLCCAR